MMSGVDVTVGNDKEKLGHLSEVPKNARLKFFLTWNFFLQKNKILGGFL